MKNTKVFAVIALAAVVWLLAACGSASPAAAPSEPEKELIPLRIYPRIGGTQDYFAQPTYGLVELPDGTSAYYIEQGKSPWWYGVDEYDAVCLWFDGFEDFDGDLSGYRRITVDIAFDSAAFADSFMQFGTLFFIDDSTVLEAAVNDDHLYWFNFHQHPGPMEFVTVEGVGQHLLNPFTSGKKLEKLFIFFVSESKDRDLNGAIYIRNLRLYR